MRPVELTPDIERHLAEDYSAWLTTITDTGIPAPNPVWFVRGSEDHIVVLTPPNTWKVRHIMRRPTVSFHFNANRLGRKSAIIIAHVSITEGVAPSTVPGYLEKYRWSVEKEMGMATEHFDQHATTRLLLQPIQVRRPPDGLSPDGVPPWFAEQ